MGAIALGGGAAWLWLPARDRPTPEVLADGVRLTSGVQGVSPGTKLALDLSPGEAIDDLSAFVDGRPAALRALGPGRAAVGATPLSQGAWHAIVVRRRGGLLRPGAVVRVSFRTADPIQVFAGWTAGGGRVNVDVGASRPLADGAPVAAALARAGATVENAEGRVLGHWTARAGAAYAFTLPAGLRAQTGSYLAAPFHAAYTAPASGDGMLMQVSGEPPTASTGLRLQVYFVSTPNSRADLARHARQIDLLSPNFYSLDGAGALHANVDQAALAIAAGAGLKVEPLVSNAGFDQDAGHQLLADPAAQARAAGALVAEAGARGYSGYQLDFENLAAADRDPLSAFARTLGAALRGAGLHLTVAVIPRKAPGFLGGLAAPYDYPALAQATGGQTVMAYQEHGGSGGAGAVAGLDWVRSVTDATLPGLDRTHVYLGVPFYYDDWSTSTAPGAGGWRDLPPLAATSPTGLQWDFDAQSAFFRYTDAQNVPHVTWLEEGASLRAKVRLARVLKVAGVSTWRLGLEDPAFWDLWPGR